MTCKQVLDLAGVLLQDDRLLNRTAGDAFMLRLVDNVVAEICAEYYPLRMSENFDSGGEILLSAFSKRVSEILKITRAGQRTVFSIKPFAVSTAAGALVVEYHYLPEPTEAEADVLELMPNVTPKTVALGVAAEFSLCKNLYDQAQTFDRKFRESLAAIAPRRSRYLPGEDFE